MKKQVLLSVFAAALFAAPTALAADNAPLFPIGNGEGQAPAYTGGEATSLADLKPSYDAGLEAKAVKATEKANGLKAVKTEDGYKLVGKGQAAKDAAKKAPMAAKAAGHKVLPKTSAAK